MLLSLVDSADAPAPSLPLPSGHAKECLVPQILVYAWAMEQDEKYTEQDNFIPWHLSERFKTQAGVRSRQRMF